MIFPFPSGVTLLKFNYQAGLALPCASCVGCLSGLAPGATRQRKGWIVFFFPSWKKEKEIPELLRNANTFMAVLLLCFNFVQCWWSTCYTKFLPPGLKTVGDVFWEIPAYRGRSRALVVTGQTVRLWKSTFVLANLLCCSRSSLEKASSAYSGLPTPWTIQSEPH